MRKQKGISQEKLAESIGVSRQAVAKWEVGQSYPELDKIIFLGDYFGISIDKLIKDSEYDNSSFKQHQQKEIANEKVIEFLCRAKRVTYAGKGVETTASRPNSHDLKYEEDNLKYIDTFILHSMCLMNVK